MLQERYKIVRHIKKGGMGAVYEARDTKLADSPCAVKEILETARLGQDSQYIEQRFFQEMKALAALDHASIPKVRDYLTVDQVVYIVMDLVQGQSLEEEIEQTMGLTGQPLNPEKSVEDILALLDTVDYLHQQQPPILHRDIKPANVLRENRSGRIKLVDFGLARQLDGNSNHTLVGTLGYCAPEQMMGKASFQSDVYSVGVTLHHMLTGKRPETISFDPLHPDVAGLRPGLAAIVEKATQPRPGDRYATCQEMRDDLRSWLHGKTQKPVQIAPRTIATPSPAAAPASRTPLLAGMAAVTLALAVGLFMGRETAPAAPAQPSQTPAAPVAPVAAQPVVPPPAPASAAAYVPPAPPRPQMRPQPARHLPPPPAPVPAPAPVPVALPRPEVDQAPAYPTYQAPPIEPTHSVGFQSPEVPEQGGPPEFQGASPNPNFQPSRPRRQFNRWRNRRRNQ